MNFLGDAHVSTAMVEMLARHGHYCTHANALPPAMTDIEVLKLAAEQNRIILTQDKDFGSLVFVHRLPSTGVLLIRVDAAAEADRVARVEKVLASSKAFCPGGSSP
jgi:predicted nuclease of predicted toxin-antitoxin system